MITAYPRDVAAHEDSRHRTVTSVTHKKHYFFGGKSVIRFLENIGK